MVTETINAPSPSAATLPFPKQGEWTYEHWLHLPEDGWTYEIIDGVLHMTPPPAIAHQDASGYLFARMRLHAEENDLGKVLPAPCGVRLPNQPVPVEPDILFIKKERLAIVGKQYVEGAPDLVVEIISPSNAHHDRDTKFKLYEMAGVPEYWLVDYQAQTVEVYHLRDAVYHRAGLYTGRNVVKAEQLLDFQVVVAHLFR